MLPIKGFERHVGSKTTHEIIHVAHYKEFHTNPRGKYGISFAWAPREVEAYKTYSHDNWIMIDNSFVKRCNEMLGYNENPLQWCSSGMISVLYLNDKCSKLSVYGLEYDPCYPYHYNSNMPGNCKEVPELMRKTHHDFVKEHKFITCLLYTSPSPRDRTRSRMPSSA